MTDPDPITDIRPWLADIADAKAAWINAREHLEEVIRAAHKAGFSYRDIAGPAGWSHTAVADIILKADV